VANRKKGSRARSRKRRPGANGAQATAPREPRPAAPQPTASAPERPRRQRAAERRAEEAKRSDYRAPGSVGERPRAPWHPFPLAELMILVGLVAIAIGAARGEAGKTILLTGVVIVVLGTLDTTVREHWSGYRSHAGLLASVPTALFHGGAALLLYALGAPSITWVLVPIALDVPLFTLLLKLLRARFADARRERVFAGQR
jgi:hypothetical protein